MSRRPTHVIGQSRQEVPERADALQAGVTHIPYLTEHSQVPTVLSFLTQRRVQ